MQRLDQSSPAYLRARASPLEFRPDGRRIIPQQEQAHRVGAQGIRGEDHGRAGMEDDIAAGPVVPYDDEAGTQVLIAGCRPPPHQHPLPNVLGNLVRDTMDKAVREPVRNIEGPTTGRAC